jgi:hypothetical protein
MEKLKSNFADKYKINDDQQIKQDILQWQSDIINGDDSAVRLTDFVISMYKPMKGKGRSGPDPYVVKVQGYQVICIQRNWISALSIYSPLAKLLLGHCDPFSQYRCGPSPLINTYLATTHYAIEAVGIDPLDDGMTKRLMIAGRSQDNSFIRLCYDRRDNSAAVNNIRWMCQRMSVSDPLLAMVKLINSFNAEERKRILDVYDNYGTIDTLVGDALIHLDKFRTL